MTKDEMMKYLGELDSMLGDKKIKLYIYGGACLAIMYGIRTSTKDIDAVYGNRNTVDKYVKIIADEYNLEENWLNDGVKGFLTDKLEYLQAQNMFKNIDINYPTAESMFAMKCLASRTDSSDDIQDIKNLGKILNIKSSNEAIEIITKYYSQKLLQQKTFYILESIFDSSLDWE